MTRHMLDLRPVKDVAFADKADIPVSIAFQSDGTSLIVSRYGDDIWDFYPYIPNANLAPSRKQLDWRIKLPDGRRLTDSEHADLLTSAKDFIWTLFTSPIEGRQRPMMRTLMTKSRNLFPLLRWMVNVGVARFSDLDGRTLDYVPVAKLTDDGQLAADSVVASRLVVLEEIYRQRKKLHDALRMHPWPDEVATSLAGHKQGGVHRKPKTEFIPDVVATRLAEVSIDYVRNRSQRILEVLVASDLAAERPIKAGHCKGSIVNARTVAILQAGFEDAYELRREVTLLRTACYIVIDLFSGIRDSEMMSIGEGCIAHGKSNDGTTDVLWLHGTIYKMGIRPKKWLVPPVVEEAVATLMRLTAPLRDVLRREESELETRIGLSIGKEQARLIKRLDTVRIAKNKLFLGKRAGSVNVICGTAMNNCLKDFCAEFGIHGEDGQPYSLYSHQFRRTYARFIARSELGDLLTLRDHFGHWTIDMTVFYTDGGADDYEADTELLQMITNEKMDRQTEIVGSYLDSETPLANGGHWLNSWRSTVRTAPNKEALIAEYAGSITLNGTGHSWCVGNAKGIDCGGLCVFEAQMCVDCNYGIIGQEHRPVWEGIRDQQNEALALDDMGIAGRERAQKIFGIAQKVLARLDVQEDT